MALKPTSSIVVAGRSIDVTGQPVEVSTTGRHDPCVGIRAVPIAEAMLALVLMDHFLRHRAQNADVRPATPAIPGSVSRRATTVRNCGACPRTGWGEGLKGAGGPLEGWAYL